MRKSSSSSLTDITAPFRRMALLPLAVAVMALGIIAGPRDGAAADLAIDAFYGHFQGAGISRSDASDYFGLTVRDFDVTIEPAENGFSVSWTTVLREGGSPEEPNIRRKSAELVFTKGARAGIWEVTGAGNPLIGAPLAWAHIDDNALVIHSMVIIDSGDYAVQTYRRTLTDLGMELLFTSVRSGETTRMVEGRLTKAAN